MPKKENAPFSEESIPFYRTLFIRHGGHKLGKHGRLGEFEKLSESQGKGREI